ncbi:MAG: hypothetical protein JWQ90_4435 [Hydrocarboniphaga sp.]|uniref:nucleotidyltransferase family protein n=1 Tax=Hydrocarboniphaga sp. TaxID=2033016 RepID=UPI0026206E7F|nr:nucleotidyltransferase family protein [Hydrocarboniphaga sp.]MDB5971985.1 hypothetical protein [Hydrocarboniphaga sp.]
MSIRPAALPALKAVQAGLALTTEALAHELASPGERAPDWSELEWRLACAVSAAHGVSTLLSESLAWRGPVEWQRFLAAQREHIAQRHRRIAELLERIDAAARSAGIAIVPLKGAALHELGVYAAGQRPMADIDLLVRDEDVEPTLRMLEDLGYYLSFVTWRHHVLKPRIGSPSPELGEHRDNPINVELHTRVQERLPISTVDISAQIFPRSPRPGLNRYPSRAALMTHLLLHAAGNVRGRGLKLLQLHDIALLASRMRESDWDELRRAGVDGRLWWALPPLRLIARYRSSAIPRDLLGLIEPTCPWLLRLHSRHQTLTSVSCSKLWIEAFPGIEWSRSAAEMCEYLARRIRPSAEAIKERADSARTQLYMSEQAWARLSQSRRMLRWLLVQSPRLDTMFVVRAALQPVDP